LQKTFNIFAAGAATWRGCIEQKGPKSRCRSACYCHLLSFRESPVGGGTDLHKNRFRKKKLPLWKHVEVKLKDKTGDRSGFLISRKCPGIPFEFHTLFDHVWNKSFKFSFALSISGAQRVYHESRNGSE